MSPEVRRNLLVKELVNKNGRTEHQCNKKERKLIEK